MQFSLKKRKPRDVANVPSSSAAFTSQNRSVSRRDFGALLAGSFGVLAATRVASAAGPYGTSQGVCDTLYQIKQQACGLAVLVDGRPGPLKDPDEIAEVINAVVCMATLGQKLLSDPDSLLFSPPDSWLFWAPLQVMTFDLGEATTEACTLACERYDAWCAGETHGVAENLWMSEPLFCRIFETAGVL